MRSTHAMAVTGQHQADATGRASTVTEFGAVVRRWCTHHRLNQSDLADDAGIHRTYLSRLVHGDRDVTDTVITALEKVMNTGGELATAAARSNDQRRTSAVPLRRQPAPVQLPAVCGTLHGRQRELRGLVADTSLSTLRVLIDGPPGVGKTALAVHHAHRLADTYRAGTLWADLRGCHPRQPAAPADILGDFLSALGLAVPESFDERIRVWRSVTWPARVLIVLDDAHSADQITPLLPGGPGCAVLITSRFRLSGILADTGVQPLTLTPLNRAHSIELLRTRLSDRLNTESDVADRIAELCGDLPAALSLAAERLSVHPDVALDVLLSEHDNPWTLTEIADEPGCSMRATLRAFYNSLAPDQQRAWRLLGHNSGQTSTCQLTNAAGWTPGHTRQVLDSLVRAHLITRRANAYEMNHLISAWGAFMHAHTEPRTTGQAVKPE